MQSDPRSEMFLYRDDLLRKARNLMWWGTIDDAEDLVQDVFVGALRDWCRYKQGKLRSWLFQRLRWEYYNFLDIKFAYRNGGGGREVKSIASKVNIEKLDSVGLLAQPAPQEDRIVFTEVMKYKVDTNHLILMDYVFGKSSKELSAKYGYSEGAINQILSRTRKLLKAYSDGEAGVRES